ncbi:MAG: hypothetical protein IH944_14525 [Armatimonadetes bacterium]|nr:hypothetical protein [Armatimonadota bacterium]
MGDVISRRDLLKASAISAVGYSFVRPLEAIAGPFTMQDYRNLVPRDKKLDPAWVRSLTERGEEPWVSGDDLRFIGMPIGGLFAGTVYLGGDGTLWNWDIFNQHHQGGVDRPGGVQYGDENLSVGRGANYVDPPEQQSPFKQYARIVVVEDNFYRNLDSSTSWDDKSWESIRFLGQYPVGTVEYSDPACSISIRQTAFSPFIPLDVDRSGYPAVVLRYTLTNESSETKTIRLGKICDNPVCIHSRDERSGLLFKDRTLISDSLTSVLFSCEEQALSGTTPRTDIVFEDWESGEYGNWTVQGSAFGNIPRRITDIADYQGDVNQEGEWLVNSHEVRNGESVAEGDQHVGTLTSSEFTIRRKYVNFRIGGGNHPGKTCINLIVDGRVVRTSTGRNSNRMRFESWDVSEFESEAWEGHLVIVDEETGGWGNVGIDDITFSDLPAVETELSDLPDYGTFCMSFVGTATSVPVDMDYTVEDIFFRWSKVNMTPRPFGIEDQLGPGESKTYIFIFAWHFPNLQIPNFPGKKRWYASKWDNAYEVAKEIAENIDELTETTLKWRDTWYDSTLPYWLLDRTFVNTSILATNTCHRFDDGRFWFWEGIGCCHGTCTHVWSYAQAAARVFPEIESYLREHIDFGLAFHEDTGAIDYRAEFARSVAHDGQCGCIMRAYREHTMQKNDAFLKRIWPNVKKATQFMMNEDPDRNGILDGRQYNTLDASWYGPMSWLSSMYLAALRASHAMAIEMGDKDFAKQCYAIIGKGSANIVQQLFNGEYFVHNPDPAHPEANATGKGCHIDQLYGQSWCHWMGLERVVPHEESKIALSNLYKYSFAPDVGPYRKGMDVIKGGRWYAVAGDGGLIMCTFPKGGAERATGEGQSAWAAMYFNECMTGFEYQAAAHMVAEGLVTEGLAVTRAIHDRYSPSQRNPYNEIECSDHYGRAMASFGVYWNVCGFKIHGPKKQLSIDPKIDGDFRCAFIAPDGWGTITRDGIKYKHRV